eukprot:13190128-Alexandrium_andersonii.AAC.1
MTVKEAMNKCGVNLARDLFGKGESEQELLRGGEHTGPIFGLFYPSAKASVKWRAAAPVIEVLTR